MKDHILIDGLKSISTLAIEAQNTQRLGAQLFNNFTSEEPEFIKMRQQILGSCENMIRDIEAIKNSISS